MSEAEPAILGAVGAPAPPTVDTAREATPRPVRPATRRGDAPTVYVAGFWHRLAAGAVDAGIVLPVALLLTLLTNLIAGIHLPPGKISQPEFWLDLVLTSDPAVVTAIVIVLAVASIYGFVFTATAGQTLGMRVLKLRVIDVYGDPPSYLRVGLRTAGYLAGLATLLLGFVWIGFDAEKRGLHDWIAGTYVIRAT